MREGDERWRDGEMRWKMRWKSGDKTDERRMRAERRINLVNGGW